MRARVKVASCHAIKGSLIEETYAVFRGWDYDSSKTENLKRARQENTIGAKSSAWVQNVSWAVSRRFDPAGRDLPLVELAKSGCDREVWKPLLLYHMTRDEFLVRDFLVHWLYPHFIAGTYRLRAEEVLPYLHALIKPKFNTSDYFSLKIIRLQRKKSLSGTTFVKFCETGRFRQAFFVSLPGWDRCPAPG